MNYNDFFKLDENKKYKRYIDNKTVSSVFDFLCEPRIIDLMITASENNRPALEGVILEIESQFPISNEFDLEKDYTLRKALGSFIKCILYDFGYRVNKQKNISKGNYIKSATHYTYDEEKAIKRIIKDYRVEYK